LLVSGCAVMFARDYARALMGTPEFDTPGDESP
jgi:hypothetical protein